MFLQLNLKKCTVDKIGKEYQRMIQGWGMQMLNTWEKFSY